jgi:ankyrin repeat protein
MDLSTRVNYLNSLLDQGAINEEEYQRRAEVLENIGKMVGAANKGDEDTLERLIRENSNIDLNQIQEGGSTILHIAVEAILRGKGDHRVLEILCRNRCAVDSVTNGFTPLLTLCQYAQSVRDLKECLNVLIRHGANVKQPVRASEKGISNQTRFAIDFALTSFASPDVIQLLCENGADPNTLTEDVPIINWCCINGKVEEARILLNFRANANSRVPGVGANCLASAISENNVELVKLLLAHGADKRIPVITSAGSEDSLTLAKVLKLSEMERILN